MKTSEFIMAMGVLRTWLIACLALFGDRIKTRFVSLQVRLDGFSGTLAKHQNGQRARYYFARVINRRRVPSAHEVLLVYTRIERSGPSGPEILFDEITPAAWQRQELEPLITRTIGRDALAVLFYVQQDGIIGLTPMVAPGGGLAAQFPQPQRGPCTLWITVRATSIEADSESIRLRIDWNGQWHDGKAEVENA